MAIFCANCNMSYDNDDVTYSFFGKVLDGRSETTVLNAIEQLFEVGDKLRQFFQNLEVSCCTDVSEPRLCQMCCQTLRNGLKWKKTFLSFCRPDGMLRSILYDSDGSTFSWPDGTDAKSEIRREGKRKPKDVVVKPLPHNDVEREQSYPYSVESDEVPMFPEVKIEPGIELYDELWGLSLYPELGPLQMDTTTTEVSTVSCLDETWTLEGSQYSVFPQTNQEGPSPGETSAGSGTSEIESEDSIVFKCDKCRCNETFPFRATLLVHKIRKHPESKNASKLRCSECTTYTAQKSDDLYMHMFEHTNEAYRCQTPNCNYSTTRVVCFDRHCILQSHNAPGNFKQMKKMNYVPRTTTTTLFERVAPDKKFECSIPDCQKTFEQSAMLYTHFQFMHVDRPTANPKVVPCHLCNYQAREDRREALLRHYINKHTREKPFRCLFPKCTRRTSRQYTMKMHCANHDRGMSARRGLYRIQYPVGTGY